MSVLRGHRALPGDPLSERRRAGFPGSRRTRAREAVRPLSRWGVVQGKPFTHDGARSVQGGRRRPGRRGGQARGKPAPGDDLRRPARDAQEEAAAVQARGGPDPRLDRTGRSLAGGPGAQGPPLGRQALVVVRALETARPARGEGEDAGLGAHADRRVHPGEARAGRTHPQPGGRSANLDPPAQLRPASACRPPPRRSRRS